MSCDVIALSPVPKESLPGVCWLGSRCKMCLLNDVQCLVAITARWQRECCVRCKYCAVWFGVCVIFQNLVALLSSSFTVALVYRRMTFTRRPAVVGFGSGETCVVVHAYVFVVFLWSISCGQICSTQCSGSAVLGKLADMLTNWPLWTVGKTATCMPLVCHIATVCIWLLRYGEH